MERVYDTCAIIDLQDSIFTSKFLISSITFAELERIKNASDKDEDVKWRARQVLKKLAENGDKFEVIKYDANICDPIIKQFGLVINNDSRIIASVYNYYCTENKDILFITTDLCCYSNAADLVPTQLTVEVEEDDYVGYKEIQMSDEELANFYNYIMPNEENPYQLENNEYLLIKDTSNKIVDKYRWSCGTYVKVQYIAAESKYFGKIVPKDDYQQIALNSLVNNQISMLRGPAGSGKSYLAFGHMFSLLERGKIDKIIIFCNTVATKGSAKLGFYPGSRTEKLLDSQIGNLLESKLGDRYVVEELIRQGQLVLLPMSDIRGYDTTGMNAAIYISEAQNLDIELMRLALQRVGEDSICIIDGDDKTQVDLSIFSGTHNGMKRVSKVFRGADFYGEVSLKNIHRSQIAKLAQEL